MTLLLVSTSEEDTQRLGEALGRAAEPGDVLLLEGPFGAGKTQLVKGLGRGLGVDRPISSPSFVIMTEHHGRLPLYHVDLYRVDHPDAALLEELDDYMGRSGITAVEWAERLPPAYRDGASVVRLEPRGETERLVVLRTDHDRLVQAARQVGELRAVGD